MAATLVGFVASHTIFIAMNVLIIYRGPFQTAVWNGLSITKKCPVEQFPIHCGCSQKRYMQTVLYLESMCDIIMLTAQFYC